MTLLRNNKEVSMVNRRSTRRRAPQPTSKPRRQTKQTKPARKIVSQAHVTGPRPITRTATVDLTALTRNIRYQQSVRANELATGDNADTLRQKRRWVQNEFEAGRLNGKATRELHDLYSKRQIGKIEQQRAMAANLSDAAKAAKQRLEEFMRQDRGDLRSDAAPGEPSDREDVHDGVGDAAAGQSTEEDMSSEDSSETEDAMTIERDDPADPDDDYGALARQRVRALGLELADYGAQGTDPYAEDEGRGDDAVVKMEGEDE